ncbi:hypothetical protein [Burkholderia savannae]|uniref:hypothetical protein n=1 Tax=Burkholderia savannae TaxID=1637837 RepID=UPI000B28CE39|nr:hypothetical protein [Burkholderia savannae]
MISSLFFDGPIAARRPRAAAPSPCARYMRRRPALGSRRHAFGRARTNGGASRAAAAAGKIGLEFGRLGFNWLKPIRFVYSIAVISEPRPDSIENIIEWMMNG